MMETFRKLVELTRGPLVESIHFGVLTVVDSSGRLVASAGDPDFIANLRSTAKPFQALSFVEAGGVEQFGLTDEELAILCASHSGTDAHGAVLRSIQAKVGVTEANLMCGVHYPYDEKTTQAMRLRGEKPTPNRHNCSGKHTGMLANALLHGYPIEDYLNTEHPLQKLILRTFAEMTAQAPEDVPVGIDGCSAPTFAAPMRAAAHAYALLADPVGLPEPRAAALRRIYAAMTSYPVMVNGPETWDTDVMLATGGAVLSKAGAEGYQGLAVAPGTLGAGSPGLGIVMKVIDGDLSGRARPTIGLAVLRRLGAVNDEQTARLSRYDTRVLNNWRGLDVGIIRAAFDWN